MVLVFDDILYYVLKHKFDLHFLCYFMKHQKKAQKNRLSYEPAYF